MDDQHAEGLRTDIETTGLPDDSVEPDAATSAASTVYVDRWNRLVSTTNWEKGRIIFEWRQSLVESGAPPHARSDEAWSRRVGGVTPQHVGRLRRVYERFGQVQEGYAGLYWSHFQAALEWSDAELWLEGAVQNGWSVAGMRTARAEAVGAPQELLPRDEDVVEGALDEGFLPGEDAGGGSAAGPSTSEVRSPADGADDDGTPDASDTGAPAEQSVRAEPGAGARDDTGEPAPAAAAVRPFEDLGPLPADLDEALEAMKLAILRQKVGGWAEVPRETVLGAVEGLRQLALASG